MEEGRGNQSLPKTKAAAPKMPLIFAMHMIKSQMNITTYAQLLCPCDWKPVIEDECRQAGTFYLVRDLILLFLVPHCYGGQLCITPLPTQIVASEDELSIKKRETGFNERPPCFQNSLFLNSLKTTRLLRGKALVLLSVFMGISALGNDCRVEMISHVHAP